MHPILYLDIAGKDKQFCESLKLEYFMTPCSPRWEQPDRQVREEACDENLGEAKADDSEGRDWNDWYLQLTAAVAGMKAPITDFKHAPLHEGSTSLGEVLQARVWDSSTPLLLPPVQKPELLVFKLTKEPMQVQLPDGCATASSAAKEDMVPMRVSPCSSMSSSSI